MIALLGSLGKPAPKPPSARHVGSAYRDVLRHALANIIVIPIAENLSEGAKEMKIKNQIVVEGVFLIARKTNRSCSRGIEFVSAPHERIDAKSTAARPEKSRVRKTTDVRAQEIETKKAFRRTEEHELGTTSPGSSRTPT